MNDAIHTDTNIYQINYIVMVVPKAKKNQIQMCTSYSIYTKNIKSYFYKSSGIIFEYIYIKLHKNIKL